MTLTTPCAKAYTPFVLLSSEEEKRRIWLNRVKTLTSPQPKLLNQAILFSLVKLVFSSASIRLSINLWSFTQPDVASTLFLRPGFQTISQQQRSYVLHAESFSSTPKSGKGKKRSASGVLSLMRKWQRQGIKNDKQSKNTTKQFSNI